MLLAIPDLKNKLDQNDSIKLVNRRVITRHAFVSQAFFCLSHATRQILRIWYLYSTDKDKLNTICTIYIIIFPFKDRWCVKTKHNKVINRIAYLTVKQPTIFWHYVAACLVLAQGGSLPSADTTWQPVVCRTRWQPTGRLLALGGSQWRAAT